MSSACLRFSISFYDNGVWINFFVPQLIYPETCCTQQAQGWVILPIMVGADEHTLNVVVVIRYWDVKLLLLCLNLLNQPFLTMFKLI